MAAFMAVETAKALDFNLYIFSHYATGWTYGMWVAFVELEPDPTAATATATITPTATATIIAINNRSTVAKCRCNHREHRTQPQSSLRSKREGERRRPPSPSLQPPPPTSPPLTMCFYAITLVQSVFKFCFETGFSGCRFPSVFRTDSFT
ncbi:hypothetical protein RIF29_16926 [Crotalaria pallida]|uniref:Uncharacterized protein n=1 Tax=Crotalaria pallida TaxID=3830 RepID=A0AAN9FG71_CROPI